MCIEGNHLWAFCIFLHSFFLFNSICLHWISFFLFIFFNFYWYCVQSVHYADCRWFTNYNFCSPIHANKHKSTAQYNILINNDWKPSINVVFYIYWLIWLKKNEFKHFMCVWWAHRQTKVRSSMGSCEQASMQRENILSKRRSVLKHTTYASFAKCDKLCSPTCIVYLVFFWNARPKIKLSNNFLIQAIDRKHMSQKKMRNKWKK